MLILLLFGVCAAYFLQQKIYQRFWNQNLDVLVRFEEPSLYEGDEGILLEEITNDKFLPLTAVEVRLGLSRNLLFSGEALENSNVSDQSYRRDVFSLFSHVKVIRKLSFQAAKRGFYQIMRSEIVGSDFFYSREYHTQKPQLTELYVYPGQTDISRIRLVCQTISGSMVRQNRLYPDPFEFSGIREYRKNDPMNHINWKASARMGELMVNQFDSTTSVQLTIVLDTRDNGILKYPELIEEGIRITASLAAELDRKHMDLNIISNGICLHHGEKEVLSLYMKANSGMMQELNQKLALLDIGETEDEIEDVLRKECGGKKMQQIYLVISRDVNLAEKGVLTELALHQNQIIWILPYHPFMEMSLPEIKGVTVLGWEVES